MPEATIAAISSAFALMGFNLRHTHCVVTQVIEKTWYLIVENLVKNV